MAFIDTLNTLLVAKFGPLGPLMALGALGVVMILATLPVFLKKQVDPMEKLQRSIKAEEEARRNKHRSAALRPSDGGDKLKKFATFLEPKSAEEMSASRMKMMQAGYRSKNAVRAFHAAQFVLGIGFLVLGLVYTMLQQVHHDVTTTNMLLYTIGPGAAGYYLPRYWIERRLQERRQQILEGFPDSLDLMLVCVEAGQSLDQSILRVSREIRAGYPALAEEFEIVSQEVKAGKDRATVLREMGDRSGVPDVASFVTVLIQSTSFGTSIADALRIYAAEMRDKRVMRAEEKANKLPTKLTLGTMLFTVPPLMIILIGPSIYGIATTLGQHH
ncbi:type II secretion system F family protein [Thioclava sp. BHET1]|nr:type II secretion system F family protein [Thioclava sp. BHET1]